MACGNNMVSRSRLQSSPVPIAMPSGPDPAVRQMLNVAEVAAVRSRVEREMDQAVSRARAATSTAEVANAVRDAEKALSDAARMKAPEKDRRALIRDLQRKLDQMKRDAARLDASAVAEHDRLSATRLGVVPLQTPIDAVLEARSVPLDIQDLLRGALANPAIAAEVKDELPEAMRKVQAVSSHAPGIATQQIAGLTVGRASPKGTVWSTTVTTRGHATGFAYEVVMAARFIDDARTPGNGGNPVHVVKGEDDLVFGQKLPAGPNRKHVEADVMVVKPGGHKIGIDSKAYSRPFPPSSDFKAELEGVKQAIRQGEVHEFHFAVREAISPTAKGLIEAADRELRAEMRDRTPSLQPTISEIQAQDVDWSRPVICWH
jgi:hypothetical protein